MKSRAELGQHVRAERGRTESGSRPEAWTWHGDQELSESLIDFAVNIHDDVRPEWLETALRDEPRRHRCLPRRDGGAARHRPAPRPPHRRGARDGRRRRGVRTHRASPRLAPPCRRAPAVHRAGRRPRRRRPSPRARPHRPGERLRPRPLAGARRRRPRHDRQPDQPDERPAPRAVPAPAHAARSRRRGRRGVHGLGARRTPLPRRDHRSRPPGRAQPDQALVDPRRPCRIRPGVAAAARRAQGRTKRRGRCRPPRSPR